MPFRKLTKKFFFTTRREKRDLAGLNKDYNSTVTEEKIKSKPQVESIEPPRGKKVYIYSITPPWGHMDALGHINNTHYFEYYEQARIAWLEIIGWPVSVRGELETGPVIINASCTFLKQVLYPCSLRVHLFVGDAGRSSFMTWCDIRGTDDTLYATGISKMVWVNYHAGVSIPLPKYIRTAILEGVDQSVI